MSQLSGIVVVIDDEENIGRQLKLAISGRFKCDVQAFTDGRDAYPTIASGDVACVLLDWTMPYPGENVLKDLADNYPETRVIVMTALADVKTAVAAMKLGAKDFLGKPYDHERLMTVVQTSLEMFENRRDYLMLKNRLLEQGGEDDNVSGIIYRSKKMLGLVQVIQSMSRSRGTVLLTGETGVGKEVFARAIHETSGVKGAFVAANVAGIDDNAFTDTLFGHKKGAFTGAIENRDGLVRKAEGGTLFLDEIGDLSHESQVKLLRFLESGEYLRLGSDIPQMANVRVVAATNADLLNKSSFRQDLYYRLKGHLIPIPPLRERMDDVPLLAHHFAEETAASLGIHPPKLAADFLHGLQWYNFPGNVRELKALMYDMVSRNKSGVLYARNLPPEIANAQKSAGLEEIEVGQIETHPLTELFGHFPTVDEVEEYMIREVLGMVDNNQTKAARILGMSRPTLNKRAKDMGCSPTE